MKWDYRVSYVMGTTLELQKKLSDLGENGWEVFQIKANPVRDAFPFENSYDIYSKKPKP